MGLRHVDGVDSEGRRQAHRRATGFRLGIGCLLFALLAGCESPDPVKPFLYEFATASDNAEVWIDGERIGRVNQPVAIDFRDGAVRRVEIRQKGYAPHAFYLDAHEAQRVIPVDLDPLRWPYRFRFSSIPPDASLYVNDEYLGPTETHYTLQFRRASPDAPWEPIDIRLEKENYLTKAFAVEPGDPHDFPPVVLQEIRRVRTFEVIAEARSPRSGRFEGVLMEAFIDGRKVGDTPRLRFELTFERLLPEDPWPEFELRLTDPRGIYEDVTIPLTVDAEDTLLPDLERKGP